MDTILKNFSTDFEQISEKGISQIVLNIVIFVITLILFLVLLNPSFHFPISNSSVVSPVLGKNNSILLPLPIKNDYITGFSLRFSYQTVLRDLKTLPEGTEIVTDVKDKNHPPFIISNDSKTYVLFKNGETLTNAEYSDLKIGQNIQIEAYYDFNHSKWYLPEVYILQ